MRNQLFSTSSRREFLQRTSNGFGAVALSALLGSERLAGLRTQDAKALHHSPKAKSVIFLYMDGGPSQVDTFDPKPRLDRDHGQPLGIKHPPTQFADVGTVLKSPWTFTQHGQSGIPVSSLFPHIATCVDELAVVRSMVSEFPEHTFANYFLHTGLGRAGRPSMGAWIAYGLGQGSKDFPAFVLLDGGLMPPGGPDNFANGFLPVSCQASKFRSGETPIANLQPRTAESPDRTSRKRRLLSDLESTSSLRDTPEFDAALVNYETAFRMQTSVPEIWSVQGETEAIQRLYGLDSTNPHLRNYARLCLVARRLVERGVRFIELTCPAAAGDRWDQHQGLKEGHEGNALAVDQPIAGLLKDLKARGLLENTLVLFGGEFGRTPMAQGKDGRDHNPHGFTMWLAGGGIRGGTIYGATDDYGYFAVENKVTMHDLHATLLHLLGFDHKRLTFRFGGRDMRLTDVHGEVVTGILS